MRGPIKLADIELSRPIATIDGLRGYVTLQGLVRLFGRPIGYVRVPVRGDSCPAGSLREAILSQLGDAVFRAHLELALTARPAVELSIENILAERPAEPREDPPSVTVAVCTRDRTSQLTACLDALRQLDYPAELDVVVVDNAPKTAATEALVRAEYPGMRYIREPRPGLNHARNRAIAEARGEIIAFTDDDTIVDPGWVRALARAFAAGPDVMALTGLVVPYELETEAQILFEQYGGFGRGFGRCWYRMGPDGTKRTARRYAGAGRFGTGANMAFRRSVFGAIGDFDPALDVGTVTNGGGDLEMFFRVLKEGHTLVYEPRAIVRHRHRSDYPRLREQIANNGVGFYSYLARSARAYPDERPGLYRFGAWWFWWWSVRRLLWSLVHPGRIPRDLIVAELRGSLAGTRRYAAARRKLARSEAPQGTPQAQDRHDHDVSPSPAPAAGPERTGPRRVPRPRLRRPLRRRRDAHGRARRRPVADPGRERPSCSGSIRDLGGPAGG